MYLDTGVKTECFGCEACAQICGKQAISMEEDAEGFRYPIVNMSICVKCGLCRKVCPYENMPNKHTHDKYAFGGYHINPETRFKSTSGGAFSAIGEAFCDENYVIFGAEAKGILVSHDYITNKSDLGRFRKSKYSQSIIGSSYKKVRKFLHEGKKVLFSGTPCQIAGLLSFLGNIDYERLLTVEVVCEGVPSPLYVRKLNQHIKIKYGTHIESIDYRYTGRSFLANGKWDFEIMKIVLAAGKKSFTVDRWFNPFWSIWLNHLMSRPSCYKCKFTTTGRTADITLGDLWGVHLYCPELYGHNGGSSLVICNTEKGKNVFKKAKKNMYGHELGFEDALKYQSPMRKTISSNPDREAFMNDLESDMDYKMLNKKWAKKPSIMLLYQKYIWGNRQKIFAWNLRQIIKEKRGKANA